jgi:protein O-GlcNAc transferase
MGSAFSGLLAPVVRSRGVRPPDAWQAAQEAFEQNHFDDCAQCCQELLDREPLNAQALSLLGQALHGLGDTVDAIKALRQAVGLVPDDAPLQHQLGRMLLRSGLAREAVVPLLKAIQLNKRFAQAWLDLGECMLHTGQHDKALHCYRMAGDADGGDSAIRMATGHVLRLMGRETDAMACFAQILQRDPLYDDAHIALGLIHRNRGETDEAVWMFRLALSANPRSASAHCHLGDALMAQGLLDEALPHFLRVAALQPLHLGARGAVMRIRQTTCDWGEGIDTWERALLADYERAVEHPISPAVFMGLPGGTTAAAQLRCASRFSETSRVVPVGTHIRPGVRPARIKVGYLVCGPDAGSRAAVLPQLLRLHNPQAFEIALFMVGSRLAGDVQLAAGAAGVRITDLSGMTDPAACAAILAQEVHILVDLAGLAQGERFAILQRRPAPIQVGWPGVPATSGTACMDYVLGDAVTLPPGKEPFYSEEIVRLADCFRMGNPDRRIAPPLSRLAYGLPAHGLVFACFNKTWKITPALFDLWAGLLGETPDAVLWLLSDNARTMGHLRVEAGMRGIAPERLVFARPTDEAQHLARYGVVDLALDTFPVSANSSAVDAIWAGCPLVTCMGRSVVSRVAASLLASAGVPQLRAGTLEGYRVLARRLAHEAGMRNALRGQLQRARESSALFDNARFVAGLEQAYEAMWDKWARVSSSG